MVAPSPPLHASDRILVDCYCRLHDKLLRPDTLFDSSWDCHSSSVAQRLHWVEKNLRLSSQENAAVPFFSYALERLILLSPAELQRLLCAISLITHREELLHCIDGSVLRGLKDAVGARALAGIIRDRRPGAGRARTSPDFRVATLIAEGYAIAMSALTREHGLVRNCLRVALPMSLPTLPAAAGDVPADRLLSQTQEWYPELTWLYG